MKIRHRAWWLWGLGALLGLWSVGCRSSQSGSSPQPILVPSPGYGRQEVSRPAERTAALGQPRRPVTRANDDSAAAIQTVSHQVPAPPGAPAVTLLRPRVATGPGTLQPVSAVNLTPATSPLEMRPEEVPQDMIAGTWKPMPRGTGTAATVQVDPSGPLLVEVPTATQSEQPLPSPTPAAQPEPTEAAPPPAVMPAPLPAHGSVPVVVGHHPGPGVPHYPTGGVPRELSKHPLPPYIIEPPDILRIQVPLRLPGLEQAIAGTHLVRPDGTVNLGIYGSVRVAGLTLDEARQAVAQTLIEYFRGSNAGQPKLHYLGQLGLKALEFEAEGVEPLITARRIDLDVVAYNSKVFYVVYDGAGFGERVFRLPVTGNDTVLDAISQVLGLPPEATKRSKIWVARAQPGKTPRILPVNWIATTQCGSAATNYQLIPGDRIYVRADPLQTTDRTLAKVLSPIERLFGVTLLGSSTVNSIKSGNNFNQ